MNFEKWEDALRREFGETLIRGEGTEGNIRGLGAEKRVENVEVEGVGLIEGTHATAKEQGRGKGYRGLELDIANGTDSVPCLGEIPWPNNT